MSKSLALFSLGLIVLVSAVSFSMRSPGSLDWLDRRATRSMRSSEVTDQSALRRSHTSSTLQTNAIVIRAVDGDTLLVRLDRDGSEQYVRLLGMNTPETVDPRKPVECFGREASQRMHELVDGQRVRLEADPQADERDKYSRLLRNAYLADGTDLGVSMVRAGYAYAYLYFPLDPKRKREIKQAQIEARAAHRGLWSPTTCNGKN